MGARSRVMLYAIQVHPHDVRDEGAFQVAKTVRDLTGVKVIGAEAATLEERHPYPRGTLPHNPVHQVVTTEARLEVPLSAEVFAGIPVTPVLSQAARDGQDYIRELTDAAREFSLSVVPWVKALNGSYDGDVDSACVRTLSGDLVSTWLCPSRDSTEEYVRRLVRAICDRYHPMAVLIDRLRYPDWSGATVEPRRLLSCFCPACEEQMAEQGIDVPALRTLLARLADALGEARTSTVIVGNPMVQAWLRFRQGQVTKLTRGIRQEINNWSREHRRSVKLWLNLWPPAFAPWLGQDYVALGRLCDGAKHFPYHRLGGGADLSGLVCSVSEKTNSLSQDVFSTIMSLLGLNYRIPFDKFTTAGLPVGFVEQETAKAKQMFGLTPIFAGIQIWDLPESDIAPAVRAAIKGGADGIFFYCYGWATQGALSACGEAVRHFGSKPRVV